MFRKRKKKLQKRYDCININGYDVSTGQVGSYIKCLYDTKGFRYIGYDFVNEDGLCRVVLYTLPANKQVIRYFEDRCPAMVEEEIKKATIVEFTTDPWDTFENFTPVR